jgi:hypothetical protein
MNNDLAVMAVVVRILVQWKLARAPSPDLLYQYLKARIMESKIM